VLWEFMLVIDLFSHVRSETKEVGEILTSQSRIGVFSTLLVVSVKFRAS
jgi:hypothetical protein